MAGFDPWIICKNTAKYVVSWIRLDILINLSADSRVKWLRIICRKGASIALQGDTKGDSIALQGDAYRKNWTKMPSLCLMPTHTLHIPLHTLHIPLPNAYTRTNHFRFLSNQPGYGNYNLIPVDLTRIRSWFLSVKKHHKPFACTEHQINKKHQ